MHDVLHRAVFIKKQDSANARHLLLSELRREAPALPALYPKGPAALKNLEHDVRIEKDDIQPIHGPFGKLLYESGGTLVLNACDPLDQGKFAALNTLMEEQSWGGQAIPEKKKVEVMFQLDENMLRVLSGAEISRIDQFIDGRNHPIPPAPRLPVERPLEKEEYPDGYKIIDLHNDPNWRWRFFGGPKQDENGRWFQADGEIANKETDEPGFSGLLVVRNPPEGDPLLDDWLVRLNEKTHKVRVERGLPKLESDRNLDLKKATDVSGLLSRHHLEAPVCIVNAGNISQVLEPQTSIEGKRLVERPSLLKRTRKEPGTAPVVYVVEELHPGQWDELMRHPAEFGVAAAPGIEIPPQYKHHVFAVSSSGYDDGSSEILAPQLPDDIDKLQARVNFVWSEDPGLTDKNRFQGRFKRLDVTPLMRSDELIYNWQTEENETVAGKAGSTPKGLPSCHIQLHQLVKDLQEGTDVAIFGMTAELAQQLASLLNPPHYLDIDGKRYHYKNDGTGELKGRVFVVTDDQKLIEKHPLSAAYVDEEVKPNSLEALEKWKAQVCANPEQEGKLEQLMKFYGILGMHGLVPETQIPPGFPVVENLFRQVFNAEASPPGDAHQVKTRQRRTLFKNMLIGEFRHDAQRYAQLKAWMKVLFRDEMSTMQDTSVDITKLKTLLGQVNHPEDIKRNAWQFLNAFSPDIIASIIGDGDNAFRHDRKEQERIRQQVLSLVCDQAQHHGLDLPPLILEEAGLPASAPLQAHMRPDPLTRQQKTRDLAEQALSRGSGVSFKGGPGAGKTHESEELAKGKAVHRLPIAQEGTKRFADTLEAWARDSAAGKPAILLIDEANLAGAENLAMLKSVFADGTLHVNGKRIKLGPKAEIVFTGNSDLLPGRTAQQVEKASFATIQFKPIPKKILRDVFVKELLDHAKDPKKIGPIILDKPTCDGIAEKAVEIHSRIQQVFPDLNLSPRNLEEYVAQVLSRLQKDGQAVDLKQLDTLLARMALNVYGSALPKEHKHTLANWLQHYLPLQQDLLPLAVSTSDGSPDDLTRRIEKTELADTPSTRELFDKVDWWLDSQELRESFNHKTGATMKTLGQQALLIEAATSRDEDAVVIEALKARGKVEGEDFVHINVDPNDLQGFLAKVAEARRKGQILLVSELDLLPSGILEGELNDLLTGHGDEPAAPGFRMIGTINPKYKGRQTLSPALRGSRMHLIKIDDYQEDELLPIAECLRDALCEVKAGGQTIISMFRVDDDKLKKLVEKHTGLNGELEGRGCSSEFRAGIRQLRNAIKLLYQNPKMQAEEAFEQAYGIYRFIAEPDNGLLIDKPEEVPAPSLIEQLQGTLALAYPHWLSLPDFESDARLAQAPEPIAYDKRRHCLRFDPAMPADRLCHALLELTKDGLPCEAEQPVSLAPRTSTSGVGDPDLPGTLGRVLNADARGRYLEICSSRIGEKIDDNDLGPPVRTVSNATPLGPRDLIVEWKTPVKTKPGKPPAEANRLYLLTEHGKCPVQVRLDGRLAGDAQYDGKRKRWYVDVAPGTSYVGNVKYGQIDDVQAEQPDDLKAEKRIRLPHDLNPEFFERIDAIKQEAKEANRNEHQIVAGLHDLFKETFVYSHEDATALQEAWEAGAEEACRRFVQKKSEQSEQKGHGVCAEIATTFAAILDQEFDIPARLSWGYDTEKNGDIPKQAHLWVKYLADGKLHVFDPTPGIPNPGKTATPASMDVTEAPDAEAAGNDFKASSNVGESPLKGCWFNTDDLPIDKDVLKDFSLFRMGYGGDKRSWQRRSETSSTPPGALNIQETLIRGALTYDVLGLGRGDEPKHPIYIGKLQRFDSDEEKIDWIARKARPLQAAINSGWPVFVCDEEGDFFQIENVFEGDDEPGIEMLLLQTPDDAYPAKPPLGKDNLILNSADESKDFFEKLERHYYELLLDSVEKHDPVFDRKNDDAIKKAVIDDLLDAVGRYRDHAAIWVLKFPIRLDISGHQLEIDREEFLSREVDKVIRGEKTGHEKVHHLLSILKKREDHDVQSETSARRLMEEIEHCLAHDMEEMTCNDKINLMDTGFGSYVINGLKEISEDSRTRMRWCIDRMLAVSQELRSFDPQTLDDEWDRSSWADSVEHFVKRVLEILDRKREWCDEEMRQALLEMIKNITTHPQTTDGVDEMYISSEDMKNYYLKGFEEKNSRFFGQDFWGELRSSILRFYGE